MSDRRSILAGLLGLGGLAAVAKGANDRGEGFFNKGLPLFFSQRDTILSFDYNTGLGTHIGTVEGAIAGTSITNFQFTPTSQVGVKLTSRVLITDISGDQLIFSNTGSGKYIVPLIADNASSLGNLLFLGGPLTGTYTVLIATGKYAALVGRKFACKMTTANASRPSVSLLGNVYLEVYSDTLGAVAGISE